MSDGCCLFVSGVTLGQDPSSTDTPPSKSKDYILLKEAEI